MQKNKFLLLLITLFSFQHSLLSMEQQKLPKELTAYILIEQQNSLLAVLKLAVTFSQCNCESKALIHSDYFISHLASAYTADKSLIALLLGSYSLPEYQEKNETLKRHEKNEEIINNTKYSCVTDEEKYIAQLKFQVAGILALIKYKLPYDRNQGLKTAINKNEAATTIFLLDSLKVSCNLNRSLLRATKKLAYSIIPLLVQRGADSSTQDQYNNNSLTRTIVHYINYQGTRKHNEPVSRELFATLQALTNSSTVNHLNKNNISPLMIARKYKQHELDQFLIKNGATEIQSSDTNRCFSDYNPL